MAKRGTISRSTGRKSATRSTGSRTTAKKTTAKKTTASRGRAAGARKATGSRTAAKVTRTASRIGKAILKKTASAALAATMETIEKEAGTGRGRAASGRAAGTRGGA